MTAKNTEPRITVYVEMKSFNTVAVNEAAVKIEISNAIEAILAKHTSQAMQPALTFEEICKEVVKFFDGVNVYDLKSKNRKRDITNARHLAIALILSINKTTSLTSVGDFFNRDHSAVIHARDRIVGILEVDRPYRQLYLSIQNALNELIEQKRKKYAAQFNSPPN